MDTLPQTMFTRWALERFESREDRSALIDLSSVASLGALKKTAVYCAAKTFNRFLTQGIYASKMSMPGKYDKLDVLSVCPGPLATKLQKGSFFGKPTLSRQYFMSQVEDTVNGALRNLGKVSLTYGSR